ncbi:hypothetical protein GP475_08945 [Corynebacterium poyangense]|uniref:HTH cro/C1-type domain-containing protein n=1 Tax=Corynebacterium poyangense TaxID=2684405 RepID=A0A7H0SQC8_9CORY|nr:helix-turn-helix transcriptional regulator [Corynebacterium poyangense]QNQ90753.1 hypothetical protein GP475_08945 [Corynebacterium poyangense]
MTNTRWWNYVTEVIGGSTYREAADRAGFDKSAFTRWKKGARADPDFVVKLARAYNTNVIEALVEAEFITKEEAKNTPYGSGWSYIAPQQVSALDETMRRIFDAQNEITRQWDGFNASLKRVKEALRKIEEENPYSSKEIAHIVKAFNRGDLSEDATEEQIDEWLANNPPVDELAERRERREGGFNFDEAVANSAPDEPGPGDEGYHDGP